MAETTPGGGPHSIEQPNQPYVKMDVTREEELAHESHVPLYWKVWRWLLVFTIAEYFYAYFFANHTLVVLLLGLLTMAIIKASMVGWYFMHLKFEGKWVYAFLIPAAIFATIVTLALVPDIAMQPVSEENPNQEDTEETSVLLERSAVPLVVRTQSLIG